MNQQFTDRAIKVFQLTKQEAWRFNHEYIGTEHLLLGLVKEGGGVAAKVLKNLNLELPRIRVEVEKLMQSGPQQRRSAKIPMTPRAKKVIENAMAEARSLGHNYVGTEHILLGLTCDKETVASVVLANLGVSVDRVRDEVVATVGRGIDESVPEHPSTQTEKEHLLHHLGRFIKDVFGIGG